MSISDDAIGNLLGGGDVDLPTKPVENVKKTAEPVDQLSEQARKNRRRSASLMTQNFAIPQLSKPGLLGV